MKTECLIMEAVEFVMVVEKMKIHKNVINILEYLQLILIKMPIYYSELR
jgi:hypothetical protein